VVSPPDRITQGLAKGAARWATARERPVHLADLARLAFHLVGEDVGLDAGGARRRCSGFERLLRRGDQVRGVATEHAVAGLGGFQLADLEPGTHRGRPQRRKALPLRLSGAVHRCHTT
jgi:hypothetical protein